MASLHLILGPVGAGKTTYGRKLAVELALGTDVILELGFYKRGQRDRVRRERVRLRNQGSATYTVEVDDAMFEWAEDYYEPLDDSELAPAQLIRN